MLSRDDALADKEVEITMHRTSKPKLINTLKYGYPVKSVISLSLKRT